MSPEQKLIKEDRKANLATTPINNQEEVLKLSYLGNRMMASSARGRLLENVGESPKVKKWMQEGFVSGANTSTTASMLGDVSASQFGSAAGTSAGVAGFAAGFLVSTFSDDNLKYVGQVFLPSKMYGEVLVTEKDAQRAMHRLADEQITAIADKLSWDLSCEVGCDDDSSYMAYRMTGSPESPLSSDFTYAPTDVILIARAKELEAVEPNDPLRALLTFKPAWKSSGPDGFRFSVFSEPTLDDSGNLMLHKDGGGHDGSFPLPRASGALSGTNLGIALKTAFHTTPYTFGGEKTYREHMLYYNGQGYSFDSLTDEDFISLQVNVPELVTVNH